MSLNLPDSKKQPALETALLTLFTQAVSDSGYTKTEIAKRAGLHRSTVSGVLNGRWTGSMDTWDLILTAADVKLSYRV